MPVENNNFPDHLLEWQTPDPQEKTLFKGDAKELGKNEGPLVLISPFGDGAYCVTVESICVNTSIPVRHKLFAWQPETGRLDELHEGRLADCLNCATLNHFQSFQQ